MNMPGLPRAFRVLIILVFSALSTVAAAQANLVTYSDPAGRFIIAHPDN